MVNDRITAALVLVAPLLATASCDRTIGTTGEQEQAGPVVPGPFDATGTPAGEGSRTPRLAETSGGFLLSWQVDEPAAAVQFAEFLDGEWSPPRTIVRRDDLFVNWADFPSLIPLGGDSLAAHWLQYNGPGTYAYQVHLAFSADGGATWSDPVVPHERRTQTEHGFVSLLAGPEGLEVVWLDGRSYAEGPEQMSLRAVSVAGSGRASDEFVLDERVCDCCQTSLVAVPAGLVVAYRDRTQAEIRDIAVTRRVEGAWTPPVPVHDDGWQIDACPVNGPALAAIGDTVLVTWFSAARDTPGAFAALSEDGGASFGPPVRIDEGRPLGRVAALAVTGPTGHRFVVAWMEALVDGGAEIRIRSIDLNGRLSPSVSAGGTSTARASGFPVLAAAGGEIFVAWTDPDSGTIRLARGPTN
ncbi:MAG TPA: exo-alpha-sialidase [Gemmatimonadota bacterium]|nr:exo-alpha-sialidase [Gemmatimonadota bacterium]